MYIASVIKQAITAKDFKKIGDILITQNNAGIRQIILEYAWLYDSESLVSTLTHLCEKCKKDSVQIIFESLLRCKRNDIETYVDMKSVAMDVEFLVKSKKYQHVKDDVFKLEFIKIFCQNNCKYIQEINRQFEQKCTSMTLQDLIVKHLGAKDSSHLILAILEYSLDPIDYFCEVLSDLGTKFDKNKNEIARIFLSRSELDLNGIRETFAKKYDKALDKWAEEKSKGSKFGFFLIQILTSVDRHRGIENLSMLKSQQSNVAAYKW